jgi:hypothetical protein
MKVMDNRPGTGIVAAEARVILIPQTLLIQTSIIVLITVVLIQLEAMVITPINEIAIMVMRAETLIEATVMRADLLSMDLSSGLTVVMDGFL